MGVPTCPYCGCTQNFIRGGPGDHGSVCFDEYTDGTDCWEHYGVDCYWPPLSGG